MGQRTRRRRGPPPTPGNGGEGGDGAARDGEAPPGDAGDAENDATGLGTAYVWGTEVQVRVVEAKFTHFLNNFRERNSDIYPKYLRLLQDRVEREEPTFNIDCMDIHAHDPQLYRLVELYPLDIIPILDVVLYERAATIDPGWPGKEITLMSRLFNLKKTVHMRDLNPSDIDQLVAIKGMVTRTSGVIPDIKLAQFKCLICHHMPDPQPVVLGRISEPHRCPRPECAASSSMSLVHNLSVFENKQVVRLQEMPDAIPEGETPHTLTLFLHEELVDACKPGDRVEVTGIFRAQPMRVSSALRTLKSLYKTYIDGIHIAKQEKGRMAAEDPLELDRDKDTFAAFPEGAHVAEDVHAQIEKLKELSRQPDIYERLARSLAPSIWELDDIKRGLLCQLFGGTAKKLSTGATFRGDINVLLVGDPGTSKSQLLNYVHKIAPRGIYTSGKGSSAVGLTAYVTRDPETREMVLESGALVLSDRGICCIDEFDKMSDNARSMLHEVMEQQTVSVAKAGIIASLNARTSVLACANPVGSRYNPRISVIENIQLPPTLLSRFDLIYLMLDKADEASDRRLARHLVALHYEEPEVRETGMIDVATLSAYISYARMHVHPELTDEAAKSLVEIYCELRGRGVGKKVITATPRQLESLIRVSEALARMRFSPTVELGDVEEARRLLEVAMQQSATDPTTGTIDMDLISTGISASARTRRAQIRDAVLEVLREKFAGRRAFRVLQVLEEMKKQTRMELSNVDIKDALTTLAAEGVLTAAGDSYHL